MVSSSSNEKHANFVEVLRQELLRTGNYLGKHLPPTISPSCDQTATNALNKSQIFMVERKRLNWSSELEHFLREVPTDGVNDCASPAAALAWSARSRIPKAARSRMHWL